MTTFATDSTGFPQEAAAAITQGEFHARAAGPVPEMRTTVRSTQLSVREQTVAQAYASTPKGEVVPIHH